MTEENWPIAIDPPGCGCTECMIGQYVPLDQATGQQVLALLAGKLHDHTDRDMEFTATIRAKGTELSWEVVLGE